MKRECKHTSGDYQIWSGTDMTNNPKKKGVYIVYWKGMEQKRFRYMYEAQCFIDRHRSDRETTYTPKPRPISEDTGTWIDSLMQNGSA